MSSFNHLRSEKVALKEDKPRKNTFGKFCPYCYSVNTNEHYDYPLLKNADGVVGDFGEQAPGLPGPNMYKCNACGKTFEVVQK